MNKGRFERKYDCDDSYFEEKSFQSIYWAGFLAADGYIPKSGHSISLSVSDKDEGHLYNFRSDIKTSIPIYKAKKENHIQLVLRFSSERNRLFLIENYNIVNNKSLVLDKPKIHLKDEIDLYIKGYIDGDGSVFLKNNVLTISIIGTKEFLTWIQKRFQELIGKRIADPKQKRKNNKNTYVLSICSKNARTVFLHYYNIECKCLERKWKKDYYIHCLEFRKNYSKSRMLHLIPEFIRYYKKDYSGMSSERKSYIKHSKGYSLFLELLDAGEVSLEDENSTEGDSNE